MKKFLFVIPLIFYTARPFIQPNRHVNVTESNHIQTKVDSIIKVKQDSMYCEIDSLKDEIQYLNNQQLRINRLKAKEKLLDNKLHSLRSKKEELSSN